MKLSLALLALPLGLVLACGGDAPVAPHTMQPGSVRLQQAPPKGSGLALDIIPKVTLP